MTTEEKLLKLKKLADAMYYAAAYLGPNVGSGEILRKAMEEYHRFVINEYNKEEPVSEDLEKASFDNAQKNYKEGFRGTAMQAFNEGAEWQKQKDANLIFNAKEDGYRLGLATMKQQLMAKAVYATVHIDAGGYPYIPQMELYDYDKDIPLAKEEDKVKIIVVKEDCI